MKAETLELRGNMRLPSRARKQSLAQTVLDFSG
jgi:hypothetical protein